VVWKKVGWWRFAIEGLSLVIAFEKRGGMLL